MPVNIFAEVHFLKDKLVLAKLVTLRRMEKRWVTYH